MQFSNAQLLILDLDDTIFPTQSMNPDTFRPVFEIIEHFAQQRVPPADGQQIIQDLWRYPFDTVAQTYQIPDRVKQEFFTTLDQIDYQLQIETFADYSILKALPIPKILVTTGFRNLQLAKIAALGIEPDFEQIHIDDPRAEPRIHKQGIFQQILNDQWYSAEQIWVIGDNPASELQAGKALGMRTVQRLGTEKQRAPWVEFELRSFAELEEVFKK